jgi:hypothetical protein
MTITNPARLLSAKPNHDVCSSGWLWECLEPSTRRSVIDRTKAALAKLHFDAIAVTGLSGLLVGSIVAMEMDKPLIIVRKRGEERHTLNECEGVFGGETYIILDDFVSSGATIFRIERKVAAAAKAAFHHPPRCLGVLEYGACSPRWNPRREWKMNYWYEGENDETDTLSVL